MDLRYNGTDRKIQFWLFLSLLGTSLEPVLVKYFQPAISPLGLIVLKSLVAGVLAAPVYKRLKNLQSVQLLPLFQVSALAFITNGLLFLSLKSIPATTLITIITTTPLLVAVVNHLRGRDQITIQFLLAFLAVFLGVLLTFEVMLKTSTIDLNIGIGYALISVITSALYRLKMDHLTREIEPLTVSGSLFAFNGAMSLLILPFVEISGDVIPFGIWLGFAGIVANIAFLFAIKHLGSTRVSVLSVIQRPLAVILGIFLLKEFVSTLQILGMVMIFIGIYFAKMKPAPLSIKK